MTKFSYTQLRASDLRGPHADNLWDIFEAFAKSPTGFLYKLDAQNFKPGSFTSDKVQPDTVKAAPGSVTLDSTGRANVPQSTVTLSTTLDSLVLLMGTVYVTAEVIASGSAGAFNLRCSWYDAAGSGLPVDGNEAGFSDMMSMAYNFGAAGGALDMFVCKPVLVTGLATLPAGATKTFQIQAFGTPGINIRGASGFGCWGLKVVA